MNSNYFFQSDGFQFVVSSCAFRGTKLEEVIEICKREEFNLEFSSGVPYRDDLAEVYLGAQVPKLIHNYYPAPKEPFVLNLASMDDSIYKKSMDHCLNCLSLTARAGSPFFSVHSGFRYDPDHRLLGTPLKQTWAHPREKAWPRFVEAAKTLTKKAEALGVKFLLENSVIAEFNVLPDGDTPFFNCSSKEMIELAKEVSSDSFGYLLDTGHWKVSSHVMSFPLESVVEVFPYIKAFHHSDNNGEEDTNSPIGSDYWFLKHLHHFKNSPHVLEVLDQNVFNIRRQFKIFSEHMKKVV